MIFTCPYSAHKKCCFEVVFVKDFGDFRHVLRIFVHVEHKRNATRIFISAVYGVIDGFHLYLRWVSGDKRNAEREQKSCYYDKICAKSAESRFIHTTKYDCSIQTMCYNVPMQKIIDFKSGLKLVFVPNTAVRSVAIGVFVGAGVVTESHELAGISHFIEHMLFKGTTSRSSYDIVNEIDSIGAQINAYTSKSYTCFHTVSIDTNAQKCADVLSDMYFNPAFDSKELEKERRVIIEEINESEDTPDDLCIEKLLCNFFKGSQLEKAILGTKKTLKDMDSDTLRAYHKAHYVAQNTVISIAGNLTQEEAISLVEKYFESRFVVSNQAYCKSDVLVRTRHSSAVKKKKAIEQTHIAFAFPSYPYNDERGVAMQLMSVVFSMEMSSRLFQSVREKLGLCYTVIGYPSSYKNNGAFIIYTSTSPQNAQKAVCAIREEIKLLLDKGVSEQELEKGKQQLKTSLVLGQESTLSMMRTFGAHAIQTGMLYDFDKRIEQIDATTTDDILRASREIFDFDEVCSSIVAQDDDVDILKLMKS